MVGQPAQAFLLHRVTPAALHPPHRQLQVNPRIATRQIAHPPGPLIVERPMGFPADATLRFFRRCTSCTMRTCGSPNTPRAVANGWKPGKRYASCSRLRLRIAISCQISPSQQSSQTLAPRGLAPRDQAFFTHSKCRRPIKRDLLAMPFQILISCLLFGRETHALTTQSDPLLLPTRNGPCREDGALHWEYLSYRVQHPPP
jgi:hypothetical protein